jgi:ATP-dependent helicase/nuclease subunit B
LLPPRLSASACEALRACPYRFFALRLLKLSAPEELDADLEKREYGTWLHSVLQRFHSERGAPMAADAEAAHMHHIAREVLHEQHLDEAEFLPYSASFARLVPRYIAWLHQRDADGAMWLDAERSLTARPRAWGKVQMHGVIDRVDFVDDKGVPTTQLIDYKTGQAAALRDAVKRGEDTQLPFYAALMAAQSDAGGELAAMYLMLDESDKIQPIAHHDVQASAAALVEGVGQDLARLAAGAAMPALGEGRACEFCDARGLCRRDHWAGSAA